MKKKIKILIPLIVFFFIGVFIKNTVSADTYTHSYINPNRTIDNVNAATYCFYNMYVPPGEYSYYEGSVQKSFDSHIKILTYSDLGEETEYSQVMVYFDENSLTKVKYNDYYYIFFKKYRYTLKKYRQNNITKEMYNPGGLSSSTLTGTTSFRNYRFGLKLKYDYSSFSFNENLLSLINDADQLAVTGFSSSSWCYSNFYEVTSTLNILGETFVNNADIQNPSYNGTLLSDKQQFIKWIIDEEKYVVFGDYGIENTADFVDDIVNLYETYQKNPLKLFIEFPSFLIKNGSIFSTYGKAKELINYISALYQEFKLERRPIIYQPELQPYLFPKPWIDDSPNEKYVDTLDDSVEIGLLREILRAIIVTPQNIFNFFDYYMYNISVNTSLLSDYVAQLPNYLTELMYNRFSPLFENIGGDSIENITNYNIENLYTLNDEHNPLLNLEVNINNKFPIINQTNNLIDFDNYIVDSPTAPVFTMKKPTISNDMKIISTEEEIIFADFSKLSTFSTIVKSIISVFFLFYFIKWIQNYIPKLLAGYNETD